MSRIARARRVVAVLVTLMLSGGIALAPIAEAGNNKPPHGGSGKKWR